MSDTYTGPVCFVDGWHRTVTVGPDGEQTPGEKLTSDGAGSYRLATAADTESHNDRYSAGLVTVEMGGGG